MFDRQHLYHEKTMVWEATCYAKYLGGLLVIFGTLTQWYLLRSVWLGQRLPDVLGDANGIAPPVNTKLTLFQKEPNFDPFNGSDSRWTSLLPQLGGGFVKVPDRHGHPLLPAPVVAPSDGTESYNVAVFHQLHCLNSIAELVGELLPSSEASTRPEIRPSRRKHIAHCFEYLRLSVRCCGDTTLEGQGKTVSAPGIDGFGSWHMCRDFEAISEWATEHRAKDGGNLPQ
ncbi:hypothetical protein F5Y16DRAFT_424424 [Xylariaceae sp. FL0255]|nr:hypothetical protein F5Y16DRAFT_424424 [Xylariaceae sp. FL0255]